MWAREMGSGRMGHRSPDHGHLLGKDATRAFAAGARTDPTVTTRGQ